MPRNNHVIIIRFHYPKNHPDFLWRFHYFAAITLPSILRQSIQDFDIAIWCNPRHAKLFKSLDKRIITFGIRGNYRDYITKPEHLDKAARGYFVDFVPWKAIRGLEKYEIQTGLDSDDMMIDEHYLEKTREVLAGSGTAHVCFNPSIFHVSTLRTFTCREKYGTSRGSAFFSLYQPKDRWEKYVFAYEESHLTISQMMDRQIFVEENQCVAISIHNRNVLTRIDIADKQVMFTVVP